MIDIQQFRADYMFHNLITHFSPLRLPGGISHSFSSIITATVVVILSLIIILLLRYILCFRKILTQKSVLLELTPPAFTEKSAYTTQQLFSVLHTMGSQQTFFERVLGKKIIFSFEIVSTREEGIRYIVRTASDQAQTIERTIFSYLPQVKVKQISEYLPPHIPGKATVIEFALKKHFAFPLAKQNALNQHDPVAYITGMMTKLNPNELIALQIIASPTKSNEIALLSHKILHNEHVLSHLDKPRFPLLLQPLILLFTLFGKLMQGVALVIYNFSLTKEDHRAQQQIAHLNQLAAHHIKPARVLSAFEQDVVASIQEKVSQPLFQTTIRALVLVENKEEQKERISGIVSSFAPFTVPGYQSLKRLLHFPPVLFALIRRFLFKHRLLSLFTNASPSLLSVSEIADLYHFPFTQVTKTENIVKALSRELPAPLSLKQDRKLSVVFGENTYGGTTTPIGLTDEERETHMYIIGRTGSGKTTLMFSMAKNDIENGKGMAFIDPHGDVSEDLLDSIPEKRINDVIYINPVDLKYPIGINLLELTPGLDEDEAELEKEVVCEGVISLFRKVFSNEENANAHRIEYILRNTIHTAFYVENATIFTVYKLLTNPTFQKSVIKTVDNEDLQDFWKNEFGRAGSWQVIKMISGVTAKVGRFLFSPTAKRILEQEKSTINFDYLMNQGKILICNFSQGNLGEDTARLLGTTILTKIQQAALRRSTLPKNKRRAFYLYVDEFQNFATNSFIKMLSEGRKYGLSVTIAEQSTSQQQERNLVHSILANVTTVVCFRSANPVDEELMLGQFSPYVEKGDIINLPRYHFYIKISALEPEESFSGKTIFIPVKKSQKKREEIIAASRKNFAIVYKRKPKAEKTKKEISATESTERKPGITIKGGLPKKNTAVRIPTTSGGKKTG